MRIKKITSAQKRIIIAALVVAFVFFAFLVFFYFPARAKAQKMMSQLSGISTEIEGIEALTTQQGRSIAEGVRLLKEGAQKIDARFPAREEDAIKLFSDFAKKLNIEVISLTPEPKHEFVKEGGGPFALGGRTCNIVSVSLEVRCYFSDLVRYLQYLKENLPSYFTVEKLKITKDESAIGKLRTTININLYLLS